MRNGLAKDTPPQSGGRVPDDGPWYCYQDVNIFVESEAPSLNRKHLHNELQDMDFGRKHHIQESNSPEPKKESRLTTIIDQLMSNKTKDSGHCIKSEHSGKTLADSQEETRSPSSRRSPAGEAPGEKRHQLEEQRSPQARDGLVTGSGNSPEGGASRVQGQQPTTPGARAPRQLPTSSPRAMPTDALAPSSTVESSNPASGSSGPANILLPKSERVSPEPESSSPSVSPHSPSPARGFPSLFVSGFGLAGLGRSGGGSSTASTAPFSPPPSLERFSPANLATGAPAIKQMEMMTRNYSDFMRSLAAKYNNQNSTQESFPMSQTNGLGRSFDGSFLYKGGSPFLIRNMDIEGKGGSVCLNSGLSRKLDNQISPTSLDSRNNTNNTILNAGIGSSCGSVTDFSSSQTLLNLVRTASAQSASQLENYLKGAVKRSAEGDNRLDPLDLSVAPTKRPKLDTNCGNRDFRDLLHTDVEATVGSGVDSQTSLRSSSSCKPAWMCLLDRRMRSSPTLPSRISPKNPTATDKQQQQRCLSLCTDKCPMQSESSDVSSWTVDDVVKFVTSVESCSEYAEKFRDQSIDGSTLPLLTEEHLTFFFGLKLGPALKLRSTVAKRIGHCVVCMHCIHCHGEENAEVRRHDSSRSPSVSK